MRKPSVLIIFLTVFIDLIGFGIVVPLIPLYSRNFGAEGVMIGIIIASFSFMQFIFAPIWGRLSDRHGRRPILLVSTAGASASYILFGVASGLHNHAAALSLIVVSRMFAGLCGGNITVAQAYIADITPPEQRSRKMGLIGMAFGLGFILGPALGGITAGGFTLGDIDIFSLHIPAVFTFHGLGLAGPGYVAATLCALNFVLALFILTESRKPDSNPVTPRPHLDQWRHTLTQPRVGLLVIVFFLATFCFSCFESTLPLVVGDNFHLNLSNNTQTALENPTEKNPTAESAKENTVNKKTVRTISYLFVYCGLIGAFVQGGAIGRMVKKMGEPKLIAFSVVLTGISLGLIPFIKGNAHFSLSILFRHEGLPWVALLATLAILSVGSSLTRPPLFGYLSNLTPPYEQGATIGVAQGAGSLARILGPVYANTLLHWIPALPYLSCTVIMLFTAFLVVQRLCRDSAPAAPDAAVNPAK
jgi:DHA1 family tetracycline resistance protein-like MFS transporter